MKLKNGRGDLLGSCIPVAFDGKSKTEKWAFTSKINISQYSLVNNLLCVLDKQIIDLQVNIQTIIHLNCGERYVHMIEHRSYTHNLITSSCEIKAQKYSGVNKTEMIMVVMMIMMMMMMMMTMMMTR